MNLHHPLEFLPTPARRTLFFITLGLTLACFAVFQFLLDPPLRTPAASAGIVSFELAGSVAGAQAMLDSWGTRARLFNALGLGFDFLFMPVYASALSLGILLAAGRRPGFWIGIGCLLGWGALIAPVFDAVENIMLFRILLDTAVAPHPQIAWVCASIKFGLIGVGLVYALAGWLFPQTNGLPLDKK